MRNLLLVTFLIFVYSTQAQILINSGAFISTSDGVFINTQDVKNEANSTFELTDGHVEVSGALLNEGTLELSGYLTVHSGVVNNGSFKINNAGSLLDDGNVTGTQPYQLIKDLKGSGPKYLSSPVNEELSNLFTGGFIYEYDEANSLWNPITSTSTILDLMTGYSVEFIADTQLTFEGYPNTGSLTKSGSYSGDGWNLLGNPYASALDWDHESVVKTSFGQAVYMWNATNQNYTTYLGSSSEAGIQVNVDDDVDASIIPKFQAFFVMATEEAPSLEVSNDARIHSAKEVVGNERIANVDEAVIKLQISNETGYYDQIAIRVHSLATDVFDEKYDAYKLLSPKEEVPQAYSYTSDNHKMAINTFPRFEKELSVSLGTRVSPGKTYEWEIITDTYPGAVYLLDKSKDRYVDITSGPYRFVAGSDPNDHRFEVIFNRTITSVPLNNGLQIFSLESGLLIKNGTSSELLEFKVYDLNGSLVYTQLLNAAKMQKIIFKPQINDGIYAYEVYSKHERMKHGKLIIH